MGQLRDSFKNWETGSKQGISTSILSTSPVWITIGKGILSETYFPHADNIVLHSLRFFIDSEADESQLPSTVTIEKDSPVYSIRTFFQNLSIKKEFLPDYDSSIVYVKYEFSRKIDGAFKIFAFSNEIEILSEKEILLKNDSLLILVIADFPFEAYFENGFCILKCRDLKSAFITLVFGRNTRELTSNISKIKDYNFNREKFIFHWKEYLNTLDIQGKGELYKRSVIVLKCMEDKVHRGACVASLALPWGSKFPLSEKNGYHLVWARDLFFISLAFNSIGDSQFTNLSLEYMIKYLMRKDGSFKQNSTIEGEERWNATQMDQIAFPIILAYKIGRDDLINELKKSADYILNEGPMTEQERWEELGGFSPYSMSLQAKALLYFYKITKKGIYLNASKHFLSQIGEKTLSIKGELGDFYFVRISKETGDSGFFNLKGEVFKVSQMISTDFLYLVFTGFYPYFDVRISKSIDVVDRVLRVETPKGISFYRYNGDIYGYDNETPKGRLWVLLTAERGIFEYMKGNYEEARKYLEYIENFKTDSLFLPEQVFEDGTPTESATPLAWSHAKYIILYDIIYHQKKVDFVNPLI